MSAIRELMTQDHRDADALFAQAEQALESRDHVHYSAACQALGRDVIDHFQVEEALLFPTLEKAVGAPLGPVKAMRTEHDDMRALFEELGEAVEAADPKRALACLETLLIMIQQHNMKEEGILYPLADLYLVNDHNLPERLRMGLNDVEGPHVPNSRVV